MFDAYSSSQPGGQREKHSPRRRTLLRRWTKLGIPLVLVGGLAFEAQATLASSPPNATTMPLSRHALPVAAAAPPAGKTWVEGVVTDQADHGQDNVNVEAWSDDPSATSPVASSLTYGGPPDNPAYLHGFFRLEVPSGQAYEIVLSAVGGKEDGDPFRMKRYGHGRPIVVLQRAVGTGRIRDLGPIALARQGKVTSKTKAKLVHKKVTASKRARVRVRVTSPYVSNVRGKVVVRVAGKRITDKLTARDHGKTTVKVPRLKRAGTYKVKATFRGSNTVHKSKAKPVKLHVRKKR